jgi:hypothetical protein
MWIVRPIDDEMGNSMVNPLLNENGVQKSPEAVRMGCLGHVNRHRNHWEPVWCLNFDLPKAIVPLIYTKREGTIDALASA